MSAKDVFLAALSRPPAERPAFLAEACGDDTALRADVESLLAFHEEEASGGGTSHPPRPSTEMFAPGQLFASRYRMVTRIGRGGMSDVWRADDLVLDTPVALKVIHATSAEGRARILNEVRLARQITHPAVCRVFDVGEAENEVFFTMELVAGEDLARLLKRAGRLPSERVIEIARQLCAGLSAAHAQGVLHRDLKPANVLIDEDGQVRITDFGIAVTTADTGEYSMVGTPGYMAPEQLAGTSLSDRTDLYALGVLLYELVAGQHPFTAARLSRQPPRPSTLVPDVNPELERVILQALLPDPHDRPASAAAMAAAFSEEAARAAESGWARSAGSMRWWGIGIALAATVVAAAVMWPGPFSSGPRGLTDQDTIVLSDFMNATGEPVFDGTLKVALAVALEQSPFLKVFGDERARQTLRLMRRSPDERITPSIAREIAQRERLKALLSGSIASLGQNYVLTLEAVNAQTGDVMAREQVEAPSREQVLTSLGRAASKMREKLGESLASIQKFDVALPKATTPSLEALHAYALGLDQDRLVARLGGVPHLQRAIELDPDFALAQALLSGLYANTGRSALAPALSRRAFELRDRVSERERFFISWRYYHDATQDWDKAFDLARSWTATYPREPFAFSSLGVALSFFGQYEQAIASYREAIRLDPMFIAAYENLAAAYIALNRFEDAKEIVKQAGVLRPDLISLRRFAYLVAFIAGDAPGMARAVAAARQMPDAASAALWEARVSAFGGDVQTAHAHFRAAVALARQAGLHEVAAQSAVEDAEAHALVDQCAEARSEITGALDLSRDNFTMERAARALALCGGRDDVIALSAELMERFPAATQTIRVRVPVVTAALAIQHGDAARAIRLLDPVTRYDHARGAEFWPLYLRGQAHLQAGNGRDASVQFQSIVDHRGEGPDSPLYPLAHRGLGRAATLNGNAAEARKHYETFFTLWSGAAPGTRLLQDARSEYAQLR